MPIATYKPTIKDAPPTLPKTIPDVMKPIAIDDKKLPLSSLYSYVNGAPWSVVYYHQVVSEHTDLKHHDINQPEVYQQYTKIMDFELRVINALTHTALDETTAPQLEGSSAVYGMLIPNIGDVFIAPAGFDNEGMYRVTNVERKSIGRDVLYGIDYSYITHITRTDARYLDLESKVINIYYFSKERLYNDQTPYLTIDQFRDTRDAKYIYRTLLDAYLK